MWTVVYVSQSAQTARELSDAFFKGGIISRIRRAGEGGNETDCCEVLVPSTEMEAAQDLIIENGLF